MMHKMMKLIYNPWLLIYKNGFPTINHGEIINPYSKDVLMHKTFGDLWRTKRGVIVAGSMPLEQSMGIRSWADTMGWILLTDIQSWRRGSFALC